MDLKYSSFKQKYGTFLPAISKKKFTIIIKIIELNLKNKKKTRYWRKPWKEKFWMTYFETKSINRNCASHCNQLAWPQCNRPKKSSFKETHAGPYISLLSITIKPTPKETKTHSDPTTFLWISFALICCCRSLRFQYSSSPRVNI